MKIPEHVRIALDIERICKARYESIWYVGHELQTYILNCKSEYVVTLNTHYQQARLSIIKDERHQWTYEFFIPYGAAFVNVSNKFGG